MATDHGYQEVLLWARANRFRVREIEMSGLKLVVDDLAPVFDPEVPTPERSAHDAFAAQFGLTPPSEYDEEETE